MERVAERSYSYRPNAMYPRELANRFLVPRLARVPKDGVEMKALDDQTQVRVPTKLELLPTNLRYDKRFEQTSNYYRFDDPNGAPYRGGLGAGERLNSKQNLHKKLAANPDTATETVEVPNVVQEGYLATLRHLIDLNHGHFSNRHPDHSKWGEKARKRILEAPKMRCSSPVT